MARYQSQVQPAQYVSQYDPAANDRTQSILQARSNNFQQSYASLAQEQAKQGEMFFLDENAKKQTLGKFNEEKDRILQKYEGDFEAAAPELTKLVVQERANPIYQANKYQQQKMAEANQMKAKLGSNAIISKDVATDLVDPETGRVRDVSDFDYDIEQRTDYAGELLKNNRGIASTLKQSGLYISPSMNEFLVQNTKQGWNALSADEQKAYIQASGEFLDKQTTFGYDPAYGNKKGQNQQISGTEFAEQMLPNLFGSQLKYNYRANLNVDESESDGTPTTPSSVVYAGGLTTNQKAFTPDTFNKTNPNVKNLFEKAVSESLEKVEPSMEAYTSGEMTLDQLQAYTIEDNLRKSNKDLNKLYTLGSKTNDDLAKEMGFKSLKDLKQTKTKYNQSSGTSGYAQLGAAMQINKSDGGKNVFERFNEKRDARNDAIRGYSNLLKDEAEKYIIAKGLDSDFDIVFYQPDFSQKGIKTKHNDWTTNTDDGYTTPDQFKYLDGDLSGDKISSDDKNKAYKGEKAKSFATMGVGGNDVSGLIWKVRNPDGTISNAKWNTGYRKQYNYITGILKNPELVEVLNGSVLNFTDKGNIAVTMPDAPPKIKQNIQKYNLVTEPNLDNPETNYIRLKNNSYLTIKDGNVRSVTNKEEALPMPKAVIFDVIKSL